MIKLQLNPEPKMLGQFAWIAPLGFGLIGLALHRAFGLPTTGVIAITAVGVVALLGHLVGARAVPLAVWRGLVLITFPIGLVLFPVALGLVYYGVFTPIGLLFRLFRVDPMARKLDRSKASYWIERGAARSPSSYFKLY